MTNNDIIRMARESDLWLTSDERIAAVERFAALVASAECGAMMQLFTDPENQPTQHGTVTLEYMQREIAAEREACAKLVEVPAEWEDWEVDCGEQGREMCNNLAAAIRSRSSEH